MLQTMNDLCHNSEYLESDRIILYPLLDWKAEDSGEDIWYTIFSKEDHIPIGRIGMVHRHPGWKNTQLQIMIQDEEKRGAGYGLEALNLLEAYIFGILGYQRIAVRIAGFNQAAVKFFKKAGYKLEGVEELGCCYDDGYYDMILLRLLRREYEGRQCSQAGEGCVKKFIQN